MKFTTTSTIATVALLSSLSAATPIKRQAVVTADLLASNIAAWQADTAAVSHFLDIASTFTDDTLFRGAAVAALNAENDELAHKGLIDRVFLGTTPAIQNANNILVNQGTFAQVVTDLTNLANLGLAAVGTVPAINANRCFNVLPAIDAYFATVENALTTSPQGLTLPVPVGGAVRPLACIPPTK
jgi:hypothetical protein